MVNVAEKSVSVNHFSAIIFYSVLELFVHCDFICEWIVR